MRMKAGIVMSDLIHAGSALMTIIANGQSRVVKVGCTIEDLLRDLAIVPARVVAQLDGVIVPRDEFDQAVLQEGSKLEIVTLVGGG
jgi:thiamine biosynthesis protein ThiS